MTPRAAITKHLLEGDDSFLTGKFDEKPAQPPATTPPAVTPTPEPPAQPKPSGTVFDPDAT